MDLRIKEVIKERGMTITELSDKMGINRVNLSNMVNGNPTVETLNKIADAIGCPVTELFEKSNVGNVIGFVKVGDNIHEVKSVEDIKELAKKL